LFVEVVRCRNRLESQWVWMALSVELAAAVLVAVVVAGLVAAVAGKVE